MRQVLTVHRKLQHIPNKYKQLASLEVKLSYSHPSFLCNTTISSLITHIHPRSKIGVSKRPKVKIEAKLKY